MTKEQMETRIRYQLHKQKITLSQLLLDRDANGRERTEAEKEVFKGSNSYHSDYVKFKRYMTSMRTIGYQDLCRMLRISEEMSGQEYEEIVCWKMLLDKEKLEVNKKRSRPTKDYHEKMCQTAESATLIIRDINHQKEEYDKRIELLQEEQDKIEVMQFIGSVSDDVLYLWKNYAPLFADDIDDIEFNFLELCAQMNDMGKQLILEILLPHLEEEEQSFKDERIALYEDISKLSFPVRINDREEIAEDIWHAWAKGCCIEYLQDMEYFARSMVRSGESDWQCLMMYRRLKVLGAELFLHNIPYIEFMNETLGKIMDAPCLRK